MDTKKLRQKILDLAIRGKLVPQDPNDEPASVLLERIWAEKERLIKEGKIKRSKKTVSDTNENEVPNGWVCCRFDEICSQFSTGPFGSMVHKSDYVSQNGTPIVNPMNIIDGKIVTNNLMMVSNEKAQELDRYKLTKDDILIARRGDLRKCCIVTEESIDWLCGTGSFFLHAPFVDPRYIEIFYLSEYVQMILKRECVGATMDNLNQSVLGSIPFLLPPLSEQRRIVNEVDRWFAVIDALESNEGDLLKAIDKAKSQILDLAIHGKLVPQDPNDEPAIDLLKRINPKFEPCDKENCSFELPNCWEWTTIGEIASSILYGVSESAKDSGNYKLLRITDIQNNKVNWQTVPFTDFDDKKALPYLLQDGDILFARTGATVGKSYLVEGLSQLSIYASYLIRVQTSNLILPSYIKMFFDSGYYWEQITMNSVGIGQPNVNGTILAGLAIPIPPYQEQLRIVAKIEELFAILDNIKESLE